jgi:hypothetical protein
MRPDSKKVRELVPFGLGIPLAFLVVAVVRVFDADAAVAYALAGFLAGGLVAGGTGYAFLVHRRRPPAEHCGGG